MYTDDVPAVSDGDAIFHSHYSHRSCLH